MKSSTTRSLPGRLARPAGWLARPAARLATLRVYEVILDQKSLRRNNEAVEEAKIDFEDLQDANACRAGWPGWQGG